MRILKNEYSDTFSFPYKALIIIGPSGAGKSTLIDTINFIVDVYVLSISHTTRLPNLNQESHGKHYYFVSREKFMKMKSQGEFAETNPYMQGNLYGTSWAEIARIDALKKVPAFDVDINGLVQLDKIIPRSKTLRIYLDVNEEKLRPRLEERRRDTQEEITKRIMHAAEEKKQVLHLLQQDPELVTVIDYNNLDRNLFANQIVNHLVHKTAFV